MRGGQAPTAFVALTDPDWLRQVAELPPGAEVNFWQPSPHTFKALAPGEPFVFKRHAAQGGRVAGFAIFVSYHVLPVSMAWDVFGPANGVRSLPEMRRRIARYRRAADEAYFDYPVGCIVLSAPVVFDPRDEFELADWHPNIQAGRRYAVDVEPGATLWRRLSDLAAAAGGRQALREAAAERYGTPRFVAPRLGQASFQTAVVDAYERRCAMTGERVLPVLEAAHIRAYAEGGEHRIDNGLLLRRDIHALFDRGYMTVTPSMEIRVSRRLRADFNNGEEYIALDGTPLRVPGRPGADPNPEFLEWHNQRRFVA